MENEIEKLVTEMSWLIETTETKNNNVLRSLIYMTQAIHLFLLKFMSSINVMITSRENYIFTT